MKILIQNLLFILILSSCNNNSLEEYDNLETTNISIRVYSNNEIVNTNNIDKNFRIHLIKKNEEKISIKPQNGIITLPILDSIPDFIIEYKDWETKFGGDMPKYEGPFIFSRNIHKMWVTIDTYPFDSTSINSFKDRNLNKGNYFMFIETDSLGWNWKALEGK